MSENLTAKEKKQKLDKLLENLNKSIKDFSESSKKGEMRVPNINRQEDSSLETQ